MGVRLVLAVVGLTVMVSACGGEETVPVAVTAPVHVAEASVEIAESYAAPDMVATAAAESESASNEAASDVASAGTEDDDAPTVWKSQLFNKQGG